MVRQFQPDGPKVDLSIPIEKVCYIITQAKELAEEDLLADSDEVELSEWVDWGQEDSEAGQDDPFLADLAGFISDLTFDEQVDLVALMWTGRDDHSAAEWRSLRTEALHAYNEHTASYLLGNPLLADHLAEGLSVLGHGCDDYD